LGGELVLRVESDGPCRANTAGDGAFHGSAGICGGEDSPPHRYSLRRTDGTEEVLKTKTVGLHIAPGDRLHVRAAGGGGWGPKAARSATARAQDAAEGLA
jgi:N-methylhydantoinase B